VIDANSPADVLESFHVCSSHLLCISSVPGATEDDYKVDEELNRLVVQQSDERVQREEEERKKAEVERLSGVKPEDVPGGGGIGGISYVSCATGDQPPESTVEELQNKVEQEEDEKGEGL